MNNLESYIQQLAQLYQDTELLMQEVDSGRRAMGTACLEANRAFGDQDAGSQLVDTLTEAYDKANHAYGLLDEIGQDIALYVDILKG